MTTPSGVPTNENNLRKAGGWALVAFGLIGILLALNVAKEGAAYWVLVVIGASLFTAGCLIGKTTV